MNTKVQVFVSSTFTDLIEERQAAVEAILKSGHIPAGMELFTAGNKSQWEVIQRWITESDIYMLILAGRYGSVEPISGLSYTELEYDFAVSIGKPFFSVIIKDDALEVKVKEHGLSILEKDNPDKLKKFRNKVLSKMSSFYSDVKDVKLCVLETLPQLIDENCLRGWVRASEVPDTKGLADEISRVYSENKQLKDKYEELSKKVKKNEATSSEDDFQELYNLLLATKIDISQMKGSIANGTEIPDEIDLMSLTLAVKDNLLFGVTNQHGISDFESFIFFRICPKLQVHELVSNEKVVGVRYRRYAVTPKGTKFFAFIDRKKAKKPVPIKKKVAMV